MKSNKDVIKVKIKKGIFELTEKEYKAAGGQAAVYCLGDTAFKIYHDPSRMISEAKIQELSVLTDPQILGPREVVYDAKNSIPIGFTMPYVDGTEFLCKIFTRGFRDDNGISHRDVAELVVKMQKLLEYIHSCKILVVDYNEMNHLLAADFKNVFHIDVDSWQTKSFPADAIMESIRDHKIKKGHFTELSDWFSFAVVTFQMYIGIHPYKGYHPKFDPKDWIKRMDLGISVFDKDVQLPPPCQDFSVIPKKHLDWYKDIFVKNDRSIPPYPDAILISATGGKIVSSKGKFVVEFVHKYDSPIKKMYFFDGKRYLITGDGIYLNENQVTKFEKSADKASYFLCDVYAEDPIIGRYSKGNLSFFDLSKKHIETVPTEGAFQANGLIYSIKNGEIVQHSFERLGNLIRVTKTVSSLCPSFKVFPGVVVQDDFMTCHLAIPFKRDLCANIHVKELDGHRIIEAECHGRVCVIVGEKNGDYYRYVICFDEHFTQNYTYWSEKADLEEINFVSLPNGLYILANNTNVLLFSNTANKKEFLNAPINASTKLFNENMTVLSVDGAMLYKVRMS